MSLDNPEPTLNDLVQQRKDSRAKAELNKPTEEVQEQEVSPEEDVVQEIESLEAHIDEPEETAAEPEELTDSEEFYVTIDDKELSFSEIRELQKGNMMQADYTRKTQGVADDRKLLESDREAFKTKSTQLDGFVDQLSVMVEEFENKDFDGYTLDELRDNDPSAYIKEQELQVKRKAKLKEIKAAKANDSVLKQQGDSDKHAILLAENNGWIKDGKTTEAYEKDTVNVKTYLEHLGMNEAQQQGILVSGHGQVYIDQARAFAKSKGNSATMKKVRKAPVVSKPGGQQQSVSHNALEVALANHHKFGTDKTMLALRKAKRKAKN